MYRDPLDLQLEASIRGDINEAWRLAQLLEIERPQDNRAAFNRGWHYLRLGDLQKGLTLTERGRLESVYGSPALKTSKPRWSGEEVRGKTILLRLEGGFGDEIVFSRFAKTFAERGARVVLACSDSIVPLLSRVPGVAQAIPHRFITDDLFDYWVPGMAAPLDLGFTYATLPGEPYVAPRADAVAHWAQIIKSDKLKVGIRWSGNPKFEHEQHRRFPFDEFLKAVSLPGVELYSLQRDHDIRDLPGHVIDLQDKLVSWEDTAAAIANLDLIITSCTSIAHLAAAMGKETWIIIPILPYYLWSLPGEVSPWYKTARLFRQEVFQNWDAPLMSIHRVLAGRVGVEAQVDYTKPSKNPMPPTPTPTLFNKPHNTLVHNSTIHFVAGLPRSGSTALMSVMAQNPRIFSAPISGLAGIFGGIHANWDKNEFHQELPNIEAKRRTLRALLENYHETNRPIILDKDRIWVMHIALLEEVLGRRVKLIIPVRPLVEVIASFEVLRQKNPLEFMGADDALGPSSTIESRAAYFTDTKGPIGVAYNAMKDAVTAGYLDRMLFVDYGRLTSAPKMQLKRIYEFLEEPYFEHDFNSVQQVAKGNSRGAHKFEGLHDVRPVFTKESRSAREVLGDVYAKYDHPEPWASWIL